MRHLGSPDRLLIVTRHYAPEPVGSGPVIQELAEWFARQGRQTDVLTVRPSYPNAMIADGYEKGQRDRVTENGVAIRRLPTWPVKPGGVLSRLGPEIHFFLSVLVRRATGRIEPSANLISLCPSVLAVMAALMLKGRGGRHIALVHDIPSGLAAMLGVRSRILLAILRTIEVWSFNRVDHVVVLSDAMMRQLNRMGVTAPIAVHPPSLDTSNLRPLPRPANMPVTLLYSGTLGRKQGLEQLLEAGKILQEKVPAFRMVICGDGPNRQTLVKRAGELGLSNLQFQPLVPKDEVAISFANGDIHLVPQIARGGDFAVPSKVFAIMAAGRPFIATADPVSCLAELAAASGGGLLVPPGNAEAFVDAILALANDPHRRQAMGQSGRRYAESHADTELVMRSIERLLSARTGAHHQVPSAFPADPGLPYHPVKRSDAIQ